MKLCQPIQVSIISIHWNSWHSFKEWGILEIQPQYRKIRRKRIEKFSSSQRDFLPGSTHFIVGSSKYVGLNLES